MMTKKAFFPIRSFAFLKRVQKCGPRSLWGQRLHQHPRDFTSEGPAAIEGIVVKAWPFGYVLGMTSTKATLIVLTFLSALSAVPLNVAHAARTKCLLITTSLAVNSRRVSKELILPQKERNWQTLVDNSDGTLVLGLQTARDSMSVTLDYLVLDINKKPNAVVYSGTKQLPLNS